MTTLFRVSDTTVRLMLAGVMCSVLGSGVAMAQTAGDPNPGALTFTGGFDVLPGAPFVFRGIVQEADPKLTLWPYGDLGIALFTGDGGLKSVGVNVGVWNSLQTGSMGLDGPTKRLHYWQEFYSTLSLGFSGDVSLGTTFSAYTSPNGVFTTVEELSFKLSKADLFGAYGVLALELTDDGQFDGGIRKGTYIEFGVGPSWSVGEAATLTVPAKVGMSLKDYYEGPAGDQKLGFVAVGALIKIPMGGVPSRFGSWDVHGGADLFFFPGESTSVLRLSNAGDSSKVVGLIGVGVTY